MPYYKWRGVQLTGQMVSGKLFATSVQDLDTLLFKRQIALISHKPVSSWLRSYMPVKLSHIVDFFSRLATLVDAGVLLPEALSIVSNQMGTGLLQDSVLQVTQDVSDGIPISESLKKYPHYFSPLIIELIHAGSESGNLAESLNMVCSHLENTQAFYARIRAALFMPFITFMFFLCMVVVIFTAIVPRFADIYQSMGKELPSTTQQMLMVTSFLQSYSCLSVLFLLLAGIYMLYRAIHTRIVKKYTDSIFISLPIVGMLLGDRFCAYFFQSMAMLIKGGQPLLSTLSIVKDSLTNEYTKTILAELEHDIAGGYTLSQALSTTRYAFAPDVIAMIEVGQESGNLGPILDKISIHYIRNLNRQLTLCTQLLQPLLLIILGLLVGILIFAVYMPIFNLSYLY